MEQRWPSTRAGRLDRPDGASIAFDVVGEGPALLFAHGLGGNQMSWWQQIPAFADRYTCVTFSHRGFAPSTLPSGVPDPADYASDAIALLNHLGIEAAVFVGQSMGGWTGIEMALADPNRLAALVLSGTTGSLSYDVYDDPDVKAWHERAPALVEELTHAGVHRATGRTFAAEQPALHALYCSIDRLNSALDKDEISRRIRATRTRGAEDAARITCPVLCVFGEDDVVISPAGVRAVAQRLPAARVVGIPATGHSTYFERASLFNSVLAGFLREIDWRS